MRRPITRATTVWNTPSPRNGERPNWRTTAAASDNSQQSIGLPDGAEAFVWYGRETVVLNTSMDGWTMWQQRWQALDALRAEDVQVTGSGTTADPWQISLTPKDGGTASYERIAFAVIETVADPVRLQAESVVYANRVQELVAAERSVDHLVR